MHIPERLGKSTAVYKGKYKDAESVAIAETKFLCILLLSPDHPVCSNAHRLSLLYTGDSNNELDDLLSRRCVIWAADIDDVADEDKGTQTDAVLTTCSPVSYPYFGVTFKNKMLFEIQGSGFSPDEFKRQLAKCFEQNEGTVAQEIAFMMDRKARDAEREYAERAEKEMMEADRRKREEKRQKEEAKEKAEREENERLERLLKEAEERKKLEEEAKLEAERRKALALSAMPEVPPDGTPADQVAKIKLTLPNGKSAERLFYRSTPLSGLFFWSETIEEEFDVAAELGAEGQYDLMAGFPPKPLEKSETITIGETKALVPRSVVTMKKK